MGEENCWERQVVITELTKGRELMCMLQKHLDPMKQDVCQYLSQEILSSYDKALSLLNGTALSRMSKGKESIIPQPSSSTAKLESPHLLADSITKSSDRACNSRKRKTISSRRAEYVHARPGEEVPPEDGYSWRKYGQKHISGEKHPREYYRCARRYLTCCKATKIVQRSETEATVFEVRYGENHSCGQESKNQNRELLRKETQSDELVGRSGGELYEISHSPEMVSTPNNSFSNSNSLLDITNSDIMTTPTSAHAETYSSAGADFASFRDWIKSTSAHAETNSSDGDLWAKFQNWFQGNGSP